MTTPAENQPNEASKIWADLDALEASGLAPVAETPIVEPVDKQRPKEQQQAAEAPAAQADANAAPATAGLVSQELFDKISGMEQQLRAVADLPTRLRNVEGKIGGINSTLQEVKSARETQASRGEGAAPTAAQVAQAQKDPAAMIELRKDYPQFAAALEAALDERLAAITKQPTTTTSDVPAVTPEQLAQVRAEVRVEIAHPGWGDTVRKPEFSGWMNRQPREVQLLAASDSPQDAIRMLDLYETSRKAGAATQTNTEQRLAAAAAIPGRGGSVVRGKPVEEMTDAEFWRYQDELDAKAARQN